MKKTFICLFLTILFFSFPSFSNAVSSETYEKTKAGIYKNLNDVSISQQGHAVNTIQLLYNAPYLEGADREEVEAFRKTFQTTRNKTLLKDALENSLELRLYVRKAIQNAGLPPELEYLPVVESYYKTTAKSSSGALGLWQFMANSVKPYLELNDYVDERLDPWKETEAALKKLKDNYNMFGDWLLAIGAYNCGAGAMQRALNKAEKKDFWFLAENKLIPLQTIQYVPKLLAIADLVMHSDFYEMDIPLHQDEYNGLYNETNGIFEYVCVKNAYSLKTLAQEMRIDYDILNKLNPSFIEGFTHPTKESTIRLPIGMKETAEKALENIKPIDFPVKYKVVKGDTLWGISKKFGVTVSQICELNNIKENAILSIGKILYIPSKLSR